MHALQGLAISTFLKHCTPGHLRWLHQADGQAIHAWNALQACWDKGGACESVSAPLAACGLLQAGSIPPGMVQWLVSKLEGQAQAPSASSAAIASALWALGHAAAYAHPTDHAVRSATLSTLQDAAAGRLPAAHACTASPSVVCAAMGGLALLMKATLPLVDLGATHAPSSSSQPSAIASSALATLLSALITLRPHWVESVMSMASSAPPALQPVQVAELPLPAVTVTDGAPQEADDSTPVVTYALSYTLQSLSEVGGALATASGLQPHQLLCAASDNQPLLLHIHVLVGSCLSQAVTAVGDGGSGGEGTQPTMPPANESDLLAAAHALPGVMSSLESLGWQAAAAQKLPAATLPAVTESLMRLLSQQGLPGAVRGACGLALGCLTGSSAAFHQLSDAQPMAWMGPMLVQLQQTGPGSGPASHPPAPASVLAGVCQALALVSSGMGGVNKGSHAAAARSGAALGLACILAGPGGVGLNPACASLGDVYVGANAAPSALQGLLGALSDQPLLAKRCIKCLEGVAADTGSAGGPGALCAWALAAASACMEGVQRSMQAAGDDSAPSKQGRTGISGAPESAGGGGGGAPKPLAAYPADGALRPLVNLVTSLSNDTSLTSPPAQAMSDASQASPVVAKLDAAAAAVRCLAAAPRLPAMDFGSVCRRLLTAAALHAMPASGTVAGTHAPVPASSSVIPSLSLAASRLQHSVVTLLLTHAASAPASGLPGALDDLLAVNKVRGLSQAAVTELLQRLPQALASLAPSRAGPLLAPLPAAVAGLGMEATAAMWEGLRGVLSDAQGVSAQPHGRSKQQAAGTPKPPAPEAVSAALAAAGALLPHMPPLPELLPGEVQALFDTLDNPSHVATLVLKVSELSGAGPVATTSLGTAIAMATATQTAPSTVGQQQRSLMLSAWAQAARCWAVARAQDLPPLLSTPQPLHPAEGGADAGQPMQAWDVPLAAAQMRCLIARAGLSLQSHTGHAAALGVKDLVPCRALCADAPELVAARCRPLLAATVCACAPHATQVQTLLGTLSLVPLAPSPVGPLNLAAAFVVAAASVVCGAQAAVDEHLVHGLAGGKVGSRVDAAEAPGSYRCSGPLLSLPHTLPRYVQQQPIRVAPASPALVRAQLVIPVHCAEHTQ